MKKQIILRNYQSIGEAVAVTAIVRDIHRWYPDQFLIDTRTPFPQIFESHPGITALDENDSNTRVVNIRAQDIDDCQVRPHTFIDAHVSSAAKQLNLEKLQLSQFAGDIHMASWETAWRSQVADHVGFEMPYWIIISGGKRDITTKWWGYQRYQAVVDKLRGKVLFVQTGDTSHDHPPLRGVIDFRGKTDIRGLVRLVHTSAGLLCGNTGTMHISAATPQRSHPGRRPAVIIGGGREPSQWWSYPFYQNFSNVGALPCNDLAGCWRERTLPLHDGRDPSKERFCVNVVGDSPRCMDMITPDMVVEAVDRYYRTGRLYPPSAEDFARVEEHLTTSGA